MVTRLIRDEQVVQVSEQTQAWRRAFMAVWFAVIIGKTILWLWDILHGHRLPDTWPHWVLYILPPALGAFVLFLLFGAILVLTNGDETWSFRHGRVDYRFPRIIGALQKSWGTEGVSEIGFVFRRLDGPDLYRVDIHLNGGPVVRTPWLHDKADGMALVKQLAAMFPAAKLPPIKQKANAAGKSA